MGRGQGELHNDDINATVKAIAAAICINAQGRSTSTGPRLLMGRGQGEQHNDDINKTIYIAIAVAIC